MKIYLNLLKYSVNITLLAILLITPFLIIYIDVFDSNESSTVMILNELVRKSDTKKSRDHSFTINSKKSRYFQ